MDQQCLGTTRSGNRCKITRNLVDGYCSLHQHQKPGVSAAQPPVAAQPVFEQPPVPAVPDEQVTCMTEPTPKWRFAVITAVVAALALIVLKWGRKQR